jgi:anti-anti-sigma factor
LTRLAELEVDDRDRIHVAKLDGELDLSNVIDVGDALAAAVAENSIGLVVDLSGVRHIDSAGVRMLFELRRRLGQRRQEVALAVPAEARIRDVLDLAAVGASVPLFADVGEAEAIVVEDLTSWPHVFLAAGLVASLSEARRLIKGGGLYAGDERIEEGSAPTGGGVVVLRKGKRERRAVRLGR